MAATRPAVKKLLNEPSHAVDEMICGLVEACEGLNRLDGHNVIVRADVESVRDTQVALVSGGGSGHEPSHGGWVGAGMLSAAVAGDIFASPSTQSVLAAILATTGSPGCLVIIKNYTGDRLNFGLACEQARAAGLRVEMVVVGDDCALPSNDAHLAHRRGLAGTLLVHKIAGAAAAAGLPLDAVAEEARRAAACVGTMGLSIRACALPAQPVSREIGEGDVEIGLGIHGEPGAHTHAMGSADSLVDELLTQVVNPAPGFGYLALSAGEPVCLVVNGLGGTTPMELAIACRRAVAALERADGMAVRVTRVLVGTFMSSLDMAGLSLSVLKLDEQRATRLDAPTAAPAWPANGCVRVAGKQPVGAPPAVRAQHALRGARADPALLHAALRRVCEQLIACAAQLNAWDQLVGDGDCGDTLRAGAERVLASLEQLRSEGMLDDSAAALAALGESAQAMGGSSGALYNIGLTAAARAAAAAAAEPEARMWASALTAAAAAISDVGGARPGYRTMLDALMPAADALRAALDAGRPAQEALSACVDAAAAGAEATKAMRANAGRAAYVPEARQQGVPDPGAMAVAEWLRALRAALYDGGPAAA